MKPLKELLQAQTRATTPSPGSFDAPGPEPEPAATVCPICAGARFVRVTADPDDPQFGRGGAVRLRARRG